ncbi:hypothetical protein RDV89_04050 [Nocardioides zeae]|uniref:FXSXX-COOH protein n=1 Tax=Nocardioides imazamoxiresistens TaxID=3231893 RepID=A0ABU3PSL1_9ACTN|nr:hypothetical protein [Nocardioides zeae]MDT9592224.1 hypothetical protein [Nocardioides zeae]
MFESSPAPTVDLDDRVGPTRVTPTGDADVDAALTALEELDGTAVDTHVAVFDRVHQGLRSVLDTSAAG